MSSATNLSDVPLEGGGQRLLSSEYLHYSVDVVSELWLYVRDKDRSALQPLWDLRHGWEDQLRSPLFPILLSVGFYFLACSPFTFLDLFCADWRWLQKFKIQPEHSVSWAEVKNALLLNVWNNIVWVMPLSIIQFVWVPPMPLLPVAPPLSEFLLHLLLAVLIFDTEYWLWHWAHHKNRWLYKHVHEFHHQYHSPSSWTTQYLHPYELIVVGTGVTTAPMLVGAHCLTCWTFYLIAVAVSIDDHVGYDFPWAPHNWVPFELFGGSVKHDMHHMRPTTNFQPWLNTWDRIFGTYYPVKRAGGLEREEYKKLSWKEKWL